MSVKIKISRTVFARHRGVVSDTARRLAAGTIPWLALAVLTACREAPPPEHRTFPTAEAAVEGLAAAASKDHPDELLAIFAPDGRDLVDVSDPGASRRNREVFTAALAEGWRLVDQGDNRKSVVVGNEGWPFPVPLVREGDGWRFDTAAGKEEIIARRVGRNELAVIRICRTYADAQRLYARQGHDGKPAGRYARYFRSEPGKQNGLYWPVKPGDPRSPLGDLVADAAAEGQAINVKREVPSPFHGYYFRILTAQGPSATGGARDYMKDGEMTGGHALIAWPARYDVTGIMTFIIGHDGTLREKDLGSGTETAARAVTLYDPDPSWAIVP
jgi:hypothetical protein